MGPDEIKWIALDASREPNMRYVGAALGVPRHPIDVGYDVNTVAEEVNEFNWFNDSKADGGSGICEGSKVTACIKPLNPTDRVDLVHRARAGPDRVQRRCWTTTRGRSSCTSPT